MARYSIEDTTLTALGDAVRSKIGETRVETNQVENPVDFYFNMRDYAYEDFEPSDDVNTYRWAFIQIETPYNTKKISFIYTTERAYMPEPSLYIYLKDDVGVNGSVQNTYTITDATSPYTKTFDFNAENYTLVYQQVIDRARYNGGAAYQYKIEGQFYFYNDNDELITTLDVDVKNTMTPEQMAQAINDMPPAPVEEDLIVSGNCKYRFAQGGWDWVINKYGDKIQTKDITYADYMFQSCGVEELPFDINIATNGSDCQYMFQYAKIRKIPSIDFKHATYRSLTSMFERSEAREIGTLKNLYPGDMSNMFLNCLYLRYLPKFEGFN